MDRDKVITFVVLTVLTVVVFIKAAVKTFTGATITIRVLSFACCIALAVITTFVVTSYIAACVDNDHWEDD